MNQACKVVALVALGAALAIGKLGAALAAANGNPVPAELIASNAAILAGLLALFYSRPPDQPKQ